MSEIIAVDGFQWWGIALPIFVLACFGLLSSGLLSKSRLLALDTHLRLACAGLLVLFWQTPGPPTTQAALVGIAVPSGADLYVLARILGTCLLSFAVSHPLYIRAAREEL